MVRDLISTLANPVFGQDILLFVCVFAVYPVYNCLYHIGPNLVCTDGTYLCFRPRRDAMYKRINEIAKALTDGYEGSCSMPDRFMLPKTKLACFIELRKRPDDLLSLISKVRGVRAVISMTTHVIVFSTLFPDETGFQFFLKDTSHTRDTTNMPGTFSLCYTRQADNVHALEAWRILRESVRGIELHKEFVDMLNIKFRNALGPGSASSAISLTRNKIPPLPLLPHLSSLEQDLAGDKLNDKDIFQPACGEKRKSNDVRPKSQHASTRRKKRENNKTG